LQKNLKSQDFDGTNIKNDDYSEDLMSLEYLPELDVQKVFDNAGKMYLERGM